VTHFAESPLTKVVDETLVVGNSPDKSRCHTKCYVASAIPLTQIGIELLADRHVVDVDRLPRIQEELSRLPKLAENVLATTDATMKQLAEKSYQKRAFYFAGTGASYANALEAALKVMETSYVATSSRRAFRRSSFCMALGSQSMRGLCCLLSRQSNVRANATETSLKQRRGLGRL